MDQLTELAIKYGTDKWGKHHYTPIYYEMFRDRINDIKSVVEIGPAEGAGLFMFRDFFPNAVITGLEIDLDRVNKLKGYDRIKVHKYDQGSAYNNYQYSDIFENADIIIDDGSHNPIDQIFTLQAVYPYLKEGAIYIIEDVAEKGIIPILSTRYIGEVHELSDRYDDRLIIIRK